MKKFYSSTAWKWFSRYMKLKYADNNHVVKCYTCNKLFVLPDKRLHLGHFHKADRHKSVCFDEKNVLPQCYTCNKFFSGRPDIMEKELIKIFGAEEIQKLNLRRYNVFKLDKWYLDIVAKQYKQLFDREVAIKGNPWKV
jgi:hypothetical protein